MKTKITARIFFALILLNSLCFAGQSGTTVITHDKVTIVTNPQKGTNSFVNWGLFPAKDREVRRVFMDVTLAHPKDRAIAHWDYLDRINILRTGGVKGDTLGYEIGRLLTPYGSNFKEDWSYTWTVDVTDFAAFLRDSVEIEYIHTGYESPELGWDLTIAFRIDFGPPVAKFISLEKLWTGGFQYGNPENHIEQQLAPIEINRAAGASLGRIRIQQTGHGMDRPNGCSEFCSRWREILVDGIVIDHRDLWKECGDNPLYPQGGTWIFDRGNWCPGDLQIPDILDVPLLNSTHQIDLNMEPFVANNVDQPREEISAFFIQYAAPSHANDVAVEEILAPNNKANYNRFNPRGFDAQIQIRNLGSQQLRSLTIHYGTEGFGRKSFQWHGQLGFWQTEVITLPGEIEAGPAGNTFFVELAEPNGHIDEWPADNSLTSQFDSIPTIPSRFVVDLLTNNKPEENSLFIVNSRNDTVFIKTPDTLKPATLYSDTLELAEGNYALALTDSAGDGLEFWFQPESGYGYLRLKDVAGHILHLFESDCGNGQYFAFRCDDQARVDTTAGYFALNIFPRMVRDSLTVYAVIHKPSTLRLRITRDGEYIETHEYTRVKESAIGLDVGHLAKGRYVMEVYVNDEHKMNRRFNKR